MIKFSAEEQMVMMLYSPGTRRGLTSELNTMKRELSPTERKLRRLADSILGKLETLTDEEFESLDLFP